MQKFYDSLLAVFGGQPVVEYLPGRLEVIQKKNKVAKVVWANLDYFK